MAAWKHDNKTGWGADAYLEYRKLVMSQAPGFRGRHEDCADLSIMLLVQFACRNGLALTFEDNGGARYISKAEGAVWHMSAMDPSIRRDIRIDPTWDTPDEYLRVVQRKIGVEALWRHNTAENPYGPQAGDLLIIYTTKWLGLRTDRHHAALVFAPYPPGRSHAKQNDRGIPDFPGPDKAKEQVNVTEYFKGTVDDDGVTRSRLPDQDAHFDYLNSRSDAKRNAELIYFANVRQAKEEGFQFRMYSSDVLDNWFDWDGSDAPPR